MPRTKRTASGVLGGLLGLVGLSAVAGVLITATVTPAIAVTGNAASGAINMFDSLPDELQIDELMLPTKIYYTEAETGKAVEMARFYEQNRIPVTYDKIAPVLIDAILSSEDGRFFTHGGIDMVGTAKALVDNLRTGENRGASSISQQYVKNVQVQQCEMEAETEDARDQCYEQVIASKGNDGLTRKLQEMRYAISLEQKYSKETILLGYLNIANFGSVNYGIEAAARYNFNVTAARLTLGQAATLAGMVQSPNQYAIDNPDSETNGAANGYALTKERQVSVLYNMHKDGKITDAEYEQAVAEPIEPVIRPQKKGCAAATGMEYYCQMVRDTFLSDSSFGEDVAARQRLLNRGGLSIYTSMDNRLQGAADQAMTDIVPASITGMKLGSSGVNIETSTGRILSVTQNTHFTESSAPADQDPNAWSSQVFATDQKMGGSAVGFATGSTFKLFTLLQWLVEGKSVNDRLNAVWRGKDYNYVANCDGSQATGTSANFDDNRGYTGNILSFTRDSLNTGFLAMASKLNNVCDVARLAEKFGVVAGGEGQAMDTNGLFWILGSNSVSPVRMAGAYAAVANGGLYCPPRAIDKVTDASGAEYPITLPKCEQVVSKEVAATALYALEGVMEGYGGVSGTGQLGNPYDGTQLAGKTGTHEAMQTWLIETSSTVTSAAWVGNIEGDANMYDFGVNNLRYSLAREMQRAADIVYPAAPFPEPDQNLTRQTFVNVPSVVGMSIDAATEALRSAGLDVYVGPEVDGSQAKGLINEQDPGPGSVSTGTTVTINPSTGKQKEVQPTVPAVAGKSLDAGTRDLSNAGFTMLTSDCTVNANASSGGVITGTDPAAGSTASKSTVIRVSYEKPSCP